MLRKSYKVLVMVAIVGAGGGLAAACVASTDSESANSSQPSMGDHVGEAQDRIITQAGLGVVPDQNNSETSATFTPMLGCVAGTTNCSTPQRWVVGYNDGAGLTLLGWAHSTTGKPGSWTTCNAGMLGFRQFRPAASQIWATFYDIRRYGGLQILLRALAGTNR